MQSVMKNNLYILLLIIISFLASSCNDFLDEMPDNRTEMDSPEKVRQLLISAYPTNSFAYLTEMMSDNTDESTGAWEYEYEQKEMYEWNKITTIDTDCPQSLWEACYAAIGAANMALETIDKLGNPKSLNPEKGEALICRAYAHFILVNVFCKHYGKSSSSDLGVPYMTKSETEVKPHYNRGTVAEVYKKIDEDLEAALPLIDNNRFVNAMKYHFNKKAAYAFATRFNLYYAKFDKVIEYANQVLGADASTSLRDWAYAGTLTVNGNIQPNLFISDSNPATLMVVSTQSSWPVVHGPYKLGRRYGHNEQVYRTETLGTRVPWGNMASIFRYGVFINSQVNKMIFRKIGYYFEYSDPVAGIGHNYMMYPAFTTDEVLLCRAEAYILKNKYTEALGDMNTFMTAFTTGSSITDTQLNDFYNNTAYYKPDVPTIKKALNPDFVTLVQGSQQENYLHCVLQLRRMLTLHEGLRWFDIKRYGIEIYRRQAGNNAYRITDTMTKDDLRRAVQIPSDIINAGMEPNPR